MIALARIYLRTWATRPLTWPWLLVSASSMTQLAILPAMRPLSIAAGLDHEFMLLHAAFAVEGHLTAAMLARSVVRTDVAIAAPYRPPDPREVPGLPIHAASRTGAWLLALMAAWSVAAVLPAVPIALGFAGPANVAALLGVGFATTAATAGIALVIPPLGPRRRCAATMKAPVASWNRALAGLRPRRWMPLLGALSFPAVGLLMTRSLGVDRPAMVVVPTVLLLAWSAIWPSAPAADGRDGLAVVHRLPVPPNDAFRHLLAVRALTGLGPALAVAAVGAWWRPGQAVAFTCAGGLLATAATAVALAVRSAAGVARMGAGPGLVAWSVALAASMHCFLLLPHAALVASGVGLALGAAELVAAVGIAGWLGTRR